MVGIWGKGVFGGGGFGFAGGVDVDGAEDVLGGAVDGEFVDAATQEVADYAAIVGVEAGDEAFGEEGDLGSC